VGERAGAHADPAAAPDRDRHAGVMEGLLPGEGMLVDTADGCVTQVEHAGVLAPYGMLLGISGPVTGRWPAAWGSSGVVTGLTADRRHHPADLAQALDRYPAAVLGEDHDVGGLAHRSTLVPLTWEYRP
jgi:hypothetical protein